MLNSIAIDTMNNYFQLSQTIKALGGFWENLAGKIIVFSVKQIDGKPDDSGHLYMLIMESLSADSFFGYCQAKGGETYRGAGIKTDLKFPKEDSYSFFEFGTPKRGPELCSFFNLSGISDNEDALNSDLAMTVFDYDNGFKKNEKATAAYLEVLKSGVNNAESNLPDKRYYHDNLRVTCYNVGQANCSAVYYGRKSSGKLLLFDFGEEGKGHRAAEKTIKSFGNCQYVVISHYHLDHLSMWEQMNEEYFSKALWIVPELPKTPNLATAMLKALWRSKGTVVHFVNNDEDQNKLPLVQGVKLFQGNSKSKSANSSENKRGLILLVTLSDKTTCLLPGDATFEDMNRVFSPTYLVIPHHCCEISGPNALANLNVEDLKEAVYMAGPNKGYHHPNTTQLSELKNRKLEIKIYGLCKAKQEFGYSGNNDKELELTKYVDDFFKNRCIFPYNPIKSKRP